MRRGLWPALAIAPIVVLAATQGASARPASCKAGVIKFGGVQARVFCGPAKATVKTGGKTFKFSQGSCDKTSTYFDVNIGTVVLGTPNKPKPNYFGLVIGKTFGTSGPPAGKDGTYKNGVVAVVYASKGYAIRADMNTITLTNGRSKGSFKAVTLEGKSVTGTFSC